MLNTEQALTRVLQIVHALGEDEAAIYNAVSKNPYEWKGAVGPIPQLYFLEQDLRRTLAEEAAAKSKKFSLQSFILANLIPPRQRVCLCEHIDEQISKEAWSGPFCELPQSYTQRAVDKVFVPISDAALECYRFTLYIILRPES